MNSIRYYVECREGGKNTVRDLLAHAKATEADIRAYLEQQNVKPGRIVKARGKHICPYCHGITEGEQKDLLCPKCHEVFGHSSYGEL